MIQCKSKRTKKIGNWSSDEDEYLLTNLKQPGDCRWIAKKLSRSPLGVLAHYKNLTGTGENLEDDVKAKCSESPITKCLRSLFPASALSIELDSIVSAIMGYCSGINDTTKITVDMRITISP